MSGYLNKAQLIGNLGADPETRTMQNGGQVVTLSVATSESWQLRHPVGPDAVPFLEWRSKMTDEEWIETQAGDDASFFARLGGSS